MEFPLEPKPDSFCQDILLEEMQNLIPFSTPQMQHEDHQSEIVCLALSFVGRVPTTILHIKIYNVS